MIYKEGHKIKRIRIGDNKEVYRAYFNDKIVFRRYHPVTAVVSTSNKQYINSEMKDFWVDDMDFEITFANNWNSVCIWGCRPDKAYQEFDVICGNDQRITVRKGGTVVNGTAPTWYSIDINSLTRLPYNLLGCQRGDTNELTRYDITTIHTVKKIKDNVYLDGKLMNFINNASCQNFFLTYLPPYFFRLNQMDFELDSSGVNSFNDNGVKYLYRATFYLKDKLYRDFIPVLDENDVPCLYEKVTHKFHYSETDTPLEYFNGEYSQLACIYNTSDANYINTNISPNIIGKWKIRLQGHSSTLTTKNITNFGMGAVKDNLGLYFTKWDYIDNNGVVTYYYEIHIGSQVIKTTIPYIGDSEVILTIDLINKKVIIERNQQEKLTNLQSETYNITSTEDLSLLPSLTLGKINGITSTGATNFRIYYSKIYDKEGRLVQNLKPRVNINTKKACMYNELTKTPAETVGTLSFI